MAKKKKSFVLRGSGVALCDGMFAFGDTEEIDLKDYVTVTVQEGANKKVTGITVHDGAHLHVNPDVSLITCTVAGDEASATIECSVNTLNITAGTLSIQTNTTARNSLIIGVLNCSVDEDAEGSTIIIDGSYTPGFVLDRLQIDSIQATGGYDCAIKIKGNVRISGGSVGCDFRTEDASLDPEVVIENVSFNNNGSCTISGGKLKDCTIAAPFSLHWGAVEDTTLQCNYPLNVEISGGSLSNCTIKGGGTFGIFGGYVNSTTFDCEGVCSGGTLNSAVIKNNKFEIAAGYTPVSRTADYSFCDIAEISVDNKYKDYFGNLSIKKHAGGTLEAEVATLFIQNNEGGKVICGTFNIDSQTGGELSCHRGVNSITNMEAGTITLLGSGSGGYPVLNISSMTTGSIAFTGYELPSCIGEVNIGHLDDGFVAVYERGAEVSSNHATVRTVDEANKLTTQLFRNRDGYFVFSSGISDFKLLCSDGCSAFTYLLAGSAGNLTIVNNGQGYTNNVDIVAENTTSISSITCRNISSADLLVGRGSPGVPTNIDFIELDKCADVDLSGAGVVKRIEAKGDPRCKISDNDPNLAFTADVIEKLNLTSTSRARCKVTRLDSGVVSKVDVLDLYASDAVSNLTLTSMSTRAYITASNHVGTLTFISCNQGQVHTDMATNISFKAGGFFLLDGVKAESDRKTESINSLKASGGDVRAFLKTANSAEMDGSEHLAFQADSLQYADISGIRGVVGIGSMGSGLVQMTSGEIIVGKLIGGGCVRCNGNAYVTIGNNQSGMGLISGSALGVTDSNATIYFHPKGEINGVLCGLGQQLKGGITGSKAHPAVGYSEHNMPGTVNMQLFTMCNDGVPYIKSGGMYSSKWKTIAQTDVLLASALDSGTVYVDNANYIVDKRIYAGTPPTEEQKAKWGRDVISAAVHKLHGLGEFVDDDEFIPQLDKEYHMDYDGKSYVKYS